MRCGRSRLSGEWSCPACGCDVYADHVPGSARPRKALPSPLGGVLAGLVELHPGQVLLLHGPRGVGKSTVALQALTRPSVVTAEMAPHQVLTYARRIRARLTEVRVPVWDAAAARIELQLAPERSSRDVLLDSLTATGRPVEALAALRAWCSERGARAIAIVQQTKEGEARGPSSLGFDCDVEVRLEEVAGQRRAVVEKNRNGPEGSRLYRLTEAGAHSAPAPRYYSVEGHGGRYQLRPHPDPGARYAEYLRAVEASMQRDEGGEQLTLPEPPAAVAAQRSALYRGGWIEPVDHEARAAFALAHGVPYFSPVRPQHGV